MWASSIAKALEKIVRPLCSLSTVIGGIALLAMVLLIVADVVLRVVFSSPITGSIELVEVLLVIVLFGGMAHVEMIQEHVKVDVILSKFPKTAADAILVCAKLLVVFIVAILSWQCLAQSTFLYENNFESGVLRIPIWPFASVSCVFLVFFFLATLTNFLKALGQFVAEQPRKYLYLIPGMLVGGALLVTVFFPEVLPLEIEETTFGAISLLVLFGLIFAGVHVGAAMAMATLWGMAFLDTTEGGLALLAMVSQTVASNYIWSVAPLFMLMGVVVAAAAFSRDLYNTAYKWMGHMKGGLASATLGACTAFAAVVGDSLSGVVTMGSIAYPEMRKYKYDTKLATGVIAVGGSLGILIPPSLGFIIYGLLTEQSIGRLFIAGLIPGVLALIALVGLVTFRCTRNPELGPAGPKFTFGEKMRSVYQSWPVLTIFLLVMGGIWLGFFTPTEAGAVGAFSAIVIAAFMGRLTFKKFWESVVGGMKLTGVVFFIFIYATAYTQYLTLTEIPMAMSEFVAGMETNRYIVLAVIMVIYLLLGCLMNSLPALILTLPIIFPTVVALGFDPIWFGVILVILVEIGQVTPPIGMSVFALQSVVKDVPMYTIFAGVLPLWLALLAVIILLVIFPQLVLFLPNLLFG